MGTYEIIDINTELDECLRNALSAENRDKFLCFISVQPWLDAINAVMIFKNYPNSIYVAGGKEWADGGRTIKKEKNLMNIIYVIQVLFGNRKYAAVRDEPLMALSILYLVWPELMEQCLRE